MSQAPTILIASSSFSSSLFYTSLIAHLKSLGLDALVFDLPSTARRPPQKAATLSEDAAFFSGVLAMLCKRGTDVVVLGHSYGGCVASECVRGYTAAKGQAKPGEGRVVGLIYFTALVPLVGKAVADFAGDIGADNFDYVKIEGEYMHQDPVERCARGNFSDLPLAEGLEWAKKMSWHSALCFSNPLTYAGYNDVDSAYILCTEDRALPPAFQQQMIANARSGGREVRVYQLAAGHWANVSVPEKLAAVICEAVRAQFV